MVPSIRFIPAQPYMTMKIVDVGANKARRRSKQDTTPGEQPICGWPSGRRLAFYVEKSLIRTIRTSSNFRQTEAPVCITTWVGLQIAGSSSSEAFLSKSENIAGRFQLPMVMMKSSMVCKELPWFLFELTNRKSSFHNEHEPLLLDIR